MIFCIKHPSVSAAAAAKSLQSCPTLCDPRDDSPPGSPIPGILQARTLGWVAISFSNVGLNQLEENKPEHVPIGGWLKKRRIMIFNIQLYKVSSSVDKYSTVIPKSAVKDCSIFQS